MLRVTLAARLALIGLIGFSVVVTVVVAIFYRTTVHENELTRPTPARLEALASMIEQTSTDSRKSLLDAVSSSQFMVRIEASSAPASGETPPQQASLRETYAAALAGRPVEIVSPPDFRIGRIFPRIARLMANAIEFRIGLRSGEMLVIDAYTRLPVTPLGHPSRQQESRGERVAPAGLVLHEFKKHVRDLPESGVSSTKGRRPAGGGRALGRDHH